METLINLKKEVGIVLQKQAAPVIHLQVGLGFDVSTSAKGMYRPGGIMQQTCDRIFALAHEFDDNKTLDAWAFDTDVFELKPVVEEMFGNYVTQYIVNAGLNIWGGTRYAPVIQAARDHYFGTAAQLEQAAKGIFSKVAGFFGKKQAAPEPIVKSKLPVLMIIGTDGENNDEGDTEAQIVAARDEGKMYLLFLGISNGSQYPSYDFLQRMAAKYDHVGFFDSKDIGKLSNEQLYSALLTKELLTWYKKVQ